FHPLHVALGVGVLAPAGALLAMLVFRRVDRPVDTRVDAVEETRAARHALATGAVSIGLAAVLVIPSARALSSVLVPGPRGMPSADLGRLLPIAGETLQRLRLAEPYDPPRL